MMSYIFTGRFQPLHKGHIKLMERARSIIPRDDLLIICIIRNSIYTDSFNSYTGFQKAAEIKHQKQNNPLPNWERFMLLRLAINDSSILKRNSAILFRNCPSINWEESLVDLPRERTFIFPLTSYTDFDMQKKMYYEAKKENVLYIPSEGDCMSGTEIRQRLLHDKDDLSFLPDGCQCYFKTQCLSYFK